ncbi:MAG: Fic family protein [Actinomycetota bacterium]
MDDVAAAASGEEPLDAGIETKLALFGYRDAMTYVLQVVSEGPVSYSSQLLKSLHFMMTRHDLNVRPGLWRAGPIYVHHEEADKIVYEGPSVALVEPLIEELVDGLNQAGDSHPMVRAAMAHLNLVMIHPFRDGNGRMARCLQTLILASEGLLAPQFCSIEEYLGRNTHSYYDVLGEVGRGTWQPHSETRPWVRFVLTAHLRQAHTLMRRIQESEILWEELERLVRRKSLPERMIPAMYDAAQGLRIRNAIYRQLSDLSEQTASRDLRALVANGLLRPNGERRGRFYTAEAELTEIWQSIRGRRNPRDDRDPFR